MEPFWILWGAQGILQILFYIAVYALPSFIAYYRRLKDAGTITLVNLLLGWTVIGWVVALVWALKGFLGEKADVFQKIREVEARLERLERKVGVLEPSEQPQVVQPKIPTPLAVKREKLPITLEWETLVGRVWFSRLGGFALVVSALLFLLYAFQKGWIGPAERVLMGIGAGIAMLAGGEWLFNKHRWRESDALSGAGIAVLFISVFASYFLYQQIPSEVYTLFLFSITLTGFAFALRHNSSFLGTLTLIAGTLTILSFEKGRFIEFSLYFFVLLLLAALFNSFRGWLLNFSLVFFVTYPIYILFTQWSIRISPGASEVVFTLAFALFTLSIITKRMYGKFPIRLVDALVFFANSIVFFYLSGEWVGEVVKKLYGRVSQVELQGGYAVFSLLVGTFFALLGLFFSGKRAYDASLRFVSTFSSLIMLDIALLNFTQNYDYLFPAMCLEAAFLIYLSAVLSDASFRVLGGIALMVLFLLYLPEWFVYSGMEISPSPIPFLHKNTIPAYTLMGVLFYAGFFWKRFQEQLKEEEKKLSFIWGILGLISTPLFLFREAWYVASYLDVSQSARLIQTLFWLLESAVVIGLGFRFVSPVLRAFGFVLAGVTFFKVFLYDLFFLPPEVRFLSAFALGVILLVVSYLYRRGRMGKASLFTLLFFFLFSTYSFADFDPKSWKMVREAGAPPLAGPVYYFIVDESTFQYTNSDASDLRLIDAKGKEIPYVFRVMQGKSVETPYSLSYFNILSSPDRKKFEVSAEAISPITRGVTSVNLKVSGYFKGRAKVFASEDAKRWKQVAEGEVYKLQTPAQEHLQLSFPGVTYKFFKAEIEVETYLGGTKTIRFDSFTAAHIQKKPEIYREILPTRQSITHQKNPAQTIIEVEWPYPDIPVEVLELHIEERNFFREYRLEIPDEEAGKGKWREALTGRLFRYQGHPDNPLSIRLSDFRSPRSLRFVIEHGDNEPLNFLKIQWKQWERRVYYPERYTPPLRVYAGNADARAPRYDWAVEYQEKDVGAGPVPLLKWAENKAYAKEPIWKKPGFITTIFIFLSLTLLLAAILVFRMPAPTR